MGALMEADTSDLRDALTRMINGYQVSQALHVAATLGIADVLKDGPRTVDDLAQVTDTDRAALVRLLRALASVGVFRDDDGSIHLTPLAEHLQSDRPGSLRAWAMHIGQPYFWTGWNHLLDSVRTGEPAFHALYGMSPWEYREAHPEADAIFNAAMTGLAAGVAEAVVEDYDFSGIDVLVDVGGGQGALLTAVLTANPRLRGILFDQPHVLSDAEAILARAGVASRCQLVGGSFFDSVPAGATAYILKNIIHDWDDTAAVRILRVCRDAMAADGRVLLVERVIQAGNDPDPAKYLDLNMLVMLGGRERTVDDFQMLLADAGLSLTRVVPTRSGFSVIEGTGV
jgi:hypothetical protein